LQRTQGWGTLIRGGARVQEFEGGATALDVNPDVPVYVLTVSPMLTEEGDAFTGPKFGTGRPLMSLTYSVARSADLLRFGTAVFPNKIPVSTSTGVPSGRYGLNLHCASASPIAFAWSGNALR
jgi:hypothetical protein